MCENGIKHGLKHEGLQETCLVESKDVQNCPENTAARKNCLEKYNKNY